MKQHMSDAQQGTVGMGGAAGSVWGWGGVGRHRADSLRFIGKCCKLLVAPRDAVNNVLASREKRGTPI